MAVPQKDLPSYPGLTTRTANSRERRDDRRAGIISRLEIRRRDKFRVLHPINELEHRV